VPDISWCIKGGSRGYVTARPLEWRIGKKHSMWLLTVPEGREFESSVPRGLRWLFSPDDPHFLKSACIHDTLLEEGFRQAFSDGQWFEAAMSEHAPPLRVWLAYSAMKGRRFLLWSLGRSSVGEPPEE
jgi:hypothetical protein